MIPPEAVPEEWAREHLRASDGTQIVRQYTDGRQVRMRIGTLVPAHKEPDLTCHWLQDNRCTVHDDAPFACAFFDCHQSKQYADALSSKGITAVMKDHEDAGLYSRLWLMLWNEGLQAPDIVIRKKAVQFRGAVTERQLDREQRRQRPPSPFLRRRR